MKLTFYINKYRLRSEIIMRFTYYLLFICLCSSCNVYKHLDEDEKLINLHKIEFIENEGDIDDYDNLKYTLKNIARPRANRKAFGLFRNRLSAYYRTEEDKKYGWYKRWLKKNIAEPPGIYDTLDVIQNVQRMSNYLHDIGYWNSSVKSQVNHKKHAVNINYIIKLNAPYRINKTKIFSKDPGIDSLLQAFDSQKILVKNALLSNENYQGEVQRISNLLRNNGYAAFLSSIYVDKLRGDTLGNYRMEVFLVQDSLLHQKYKFGNINIHLDGIEDTGKHMNQDTLDGIIYHYTGVKPFIKPKLINKKIEFRSGQSYSKKAVDDSRVLLGELAILNRTSISNNIGDTTNVLDYTFHLQRKLKYGWNTDLTTGYTLVTNQGAGIQTPNRIGIFGSLGFSDRNTFRGGEVFTTQVRGGIEFDFLNPNRNGIISTDFQYKNSLKIPAFKDIYGSYRFLKKLGLLNEKFYNEIKRKGTTNIGANVQFLNFTNFYSYQNYEVNLGHSIRYNNINYNITQTGINFWKPNLTDTFRTINANNQNLLRSFEPRLLTGIFFRGINLSYFSPPNRRGLQFNFFGNIDASGHEIFLANQIYRWVSNTKTIFNAGTIDRDPLYFAQYFKFELDGRLIKKINLNSSITGRANVGLAVPYGFIKGTNVVPYVSQFSVGGPFSIRGWETRELGPGATVPNTNGNITSYAQKGDIKLEFNLEYRHRLFWYLHLALFADAGNVWVLKKQGSNADEIFGSKFIDQFAIGSGYGLRFDYDGRFVVRLDMGYKVRQPYNDTGGDNWIFNQIKLGAANYNFAIGYPF